MNIFQIPTLEDNDHPEGRIIGLVDSSGSMGSNWPHLAKHWNLTIPKENTLTLTFDTVPHLCQTNILDSNINKHGGNCTDIYKIFERFEEELQKIDKSIPLTVLFISDGAHNSGGSINTLLPKLKGNTDGRKINFLCLGVGKSFPTFIAMTLREKYHTGDMTIPAIFMIEFITEKAYEIKFAALKKYFSFNQPRKINPPVCLFPWREYTTEVFENSWVMSNDDKVKIDEDDMEISEFNLNIKGIQELFRSWSQMMQIDSTKEGEDIASRAKKTLIQMDEILEELKEVKKIDLLAITDTKGDESKLSFKERAWNNFLRHNYERTKWFYDDVKNLAESDNKKLSAFEAAKKIGVGTIVGNYQMKLMNLKNLTVEKFRKIKEDFKTILKSTNISDVAENAPYQSIRKIFLEPDFIKGLDHCKSSYDLCESLPLIGLPIRMVKTNPDATDSWSLEIKYISNTKDYVDSAMIFKNDGGWPVIDNEKKETVNTIVPLLTKNDKDLLPLYRSEFFKVLMTVNILNNGDFIANDGYEALLVQTLVKILEKDKLGDFEKNTIDRILDSAEIYLNDQEDFKEFMAKVENNLMGCISNEKKENSKNILAILMNNRMKKLDVKNVEDYLNVLFYDILRKTFQNKLLSVIKGENLSGKEGDKLLELIEKDVILNFKNFYTNGDFSRCLKKIYLETIADKKVNIIVDKKEILRQLNSINMLKNLGEFCGVNLDVDKKIDKLIYLVNKVETENLAKLSQTEKEKIINETQTILRKEYFVNLLNKKKMKSNKNNPIFLTKEFINLEKKLRDQFTQFFKAIHKNILPISVEDLKKLNDIKKTKIEINNIKLFRKVCMAKNCKFYGKNHQGKRLSHHMAVWGNRLPIGFHLKLSKSFNDDGKVIFEQLFGGKYNEEQYGYTKEEVMEYISLLKDSYKKISYN